jgi:glucokinase-like ROK family protein
MFQQSINAIVRALASKAVWTFRLKILVTASSGAEVRAIGWYCQPIDVEFWSLTIPSRRLVLNNFKTGNHGMLRQQNLAGIMHHLYENAPISRIELARRTGLNKATVSSLINELINNQFVREIGAGTTVRAGRREVLLDINPARGCIVSGEIGGDFISVICTDFTAEVIWRQTYKVSNSMSQTAILNRTVKLLRQALTIGAAQAGPPLGLALGVPGLIDRDKGTLLFAPNLGWENVAVAELLRRSFDVPIFVDNEATLAALGEQYFGAAKGYSEVLYISAGVGLGGGLVLNGNLYNGSAGFAAEFGHMTMEPNGERCKCGNRGCWETQISQAALFRYVTDAIRQGHPTSLTEMINGQPEQLTVAAIVEAAKGGDKLALTALQKLGRHLGIGIASLVNALNPRLVVFGGVLSLAGDLLLPIVTEELHQRALHWNEETARIVIARFGSDASVMGGVAKVFQTVLANPAQTGLA